MKLSSTKIKIIGGVLVGLMLFTVGAAAIATETGIISNSKPKIAQMSIQNNQNIQKNADLKAAILEAVANGSITQQKADVLLANIEKQEANRKAQVPLQQAPNGNNGQPPKPPMGVDNMGGPFEGAVKDGVINTDEAKAIENILKAKNIVARKEATAKILAKLVTDGIITAEQSSKIILSIDKDEADRQAEIEKVTAMTDVERKTYLEQNKHEPKPPFADLIANGTLTKEQADAVAKAMMPMGDMGRGGCCPMGNGGPNCNNLPPMPPMQPFAPANNNN